MKKFQVVIIGSGASGSMLAIKLAQQNMSVAVIDENDIPAKKLLVTGNGKCNITNENLNSKFYNQNIDRFLKKFDVKKTKEFFSSIGVQIYADDENRCYPLSNSAKSVVVAIQNQFEKLNIAFFGKQKFLSFQRLTSGFMVKTNIDEFACEYLIFACRTCENFDEYQVEVRPFCKSLVSLKTKQNTKILDGVRCQNVLVSVVDNGKILKQQCGEVLFKDHGLSGICIFNLSSFFARKNDFTGKITINFLPNISKENLLKMIENNAKIYSKNQILTSILHEKLEKYILSLFPKDFKSNELISKVQGLEFDVCDCYDNNQVFSGGVKLSSLTENLENKNIKNMFFVGEICDVDGECGGFNLQWAWTSASIVAETIKKN